jgi:purine-binding chemotaxis protein CheW
MATRSFATFHLNEQLFGIDILLIREINKQLDISIVPHSPNYIRGLVNLRGQIVTILDLNKRLSLGDSVLSGNSHNVILKTEAEVSSIREREGRNDLASSTDKVGFLVNDIQDVITIDDSEIEPSLVNSNGIEGKYFDGVVKLDNALMSILNVKRIIEDQ